MSLEDVTLGLFALCNSLRIAAYVPQMHKAAIDRHGASAISSTTWGLFLVAHLSTVVYALVNRADWGLAACFAANAVCCGAIIAVAHWNRRRHAARLSRDGLGPCGTDPSALTPAAEWDQTCTACEAASPGSVALRV
jgi:hypothetical protein